MLKMLGMVGWGGGEGATGVDKNKVYIKGVAEYVLHVFALDHRPNSQW
jgi:hypothetical protein